MSNLSKKVLLINKNYQAIRTITIKRAIKLLWSENAVIVQPPNGESNSWQEFTWQDWSVIKPKDDEDSLKTPSQVFKIPEIIKLENYSKTPSQTVRLTRRAIFKRDDYQCQFCGEKPSSDEISIDHLIARSRGGENSWTNMVLACFRCNRKKADKTPEECGMKLIKKPIKPAFDVLNGEKIRCDSWKNFISDVYWNTELR